jgi:ABC-type glycerol-3-phosphate transport system substrate-binding protein
MAFPFGRPILCMAAVAAASGAAILTRPTHPSADLTVWTFTTTDAAADRAAAHAFTRATGHAVRVDLVAAQAMEVRLSSLFMADLRPAVDPSRPDVVELEVGSVGKFLRGSPGDVGFLPLDGYLRRGGWLDHIVPGRLVPYTYGGHVFGVPLDLHPVTLVYRRDLIDLAAADTWPRVQAECLRLQRSRPGRFTLSLSGTSPDTLMVMLQQRHVDLVDANGVPHLTDPVVVDTLRWYARAAAGPDRIAADVNPAPGGTAADLASGDVAAAVLADWAVAALGRSQPSLAGKLTMVPLPRFDPDDARTASWGGTMVGIPRFCPRPDRAWDWIERTYLNTDAADARWRVTGVLPPLPSAWAGPAFHRPDPFFGGQRVTELYMRLSTEMPRRTVTPYTVTAQNLLAWALSRAVVRVRQSGDVTRTDCQSWLQARQDQLQRLIDFDRGSAAGT